MSYTLGNSSGFGNSLGFPELLKFSQSRIQFIPTETHKAKSENGKVHIKQILEETRWGFQGSSLSETTQKTLNSYSKLQWHMANFIYQERSLYLSSRIWQAEVGDMNSFWETYNNIPDTPNERKCSAWATLFRQFRHFGILKTVEKLLIQILRCQPMNNHVS